MKRIIVFYDSSDIALAREVAKEINAAGFLSWLADDDSRTDWNSEVEELIASENCVGAVAIWSRAATKNSIVRDEAREITRVAKPLLGLHLGDGGNAPIGLRDGPRHQLERGGSGKLGGQLTSKIKAVFSVDTNLERVLVLNDKKLLAPSMVLSVSSFETQIEPCPSSGILGQTAA